MRQASAVVIDDRCVGNGLVVGDADVMERGNSDVVKFDGKTTCCAFDIASQGSNFLSNRDWARSVNGQHGLTRRQHAVQRVLWPNFASTCVLIPSTPSPRA